jgi:phage gp36-like protein
MAYATIEQLAASWRDFAPYEAGRVKQTLEDASVFLDEELAASGRDPSAVSSDLLRIVCCNLVRRSMGELDPTNADDRWQQTVEPDVVNVTPAVVHSDFYFTQWERLVLRIRAGRAGFAGAE